MIHPRRTMEDYNADQKKDHPREKRGVFVREIMRQKQGVPPFFVTYRLTK